MDSEIIVTRDNVELLLALAKSRPCGRQAVARVPISKRASETTMDLIWWAADKLETSAEFPLAARILTELGQVYPEYTARHLAAAVR